MKRYVPLAVILVAALLAIYFAQRQQVATQASPQALVNAAADAEHEASRVPLQMDRMPDADEIRVGDEMAASYQKMWAPKGGKDAEAASRSRGTCRRWVRTWRRTRDGSCRTSSTTFRKRIL